MLYRTAKKIGMAVFAAALILSMLGGAALAAGNGFTDDVDKTNRDIAKLIGDAVEDADHAMVECCRQVDEELRRLVKDPQKKEEVDRNIDKLRANFEKKLDRIAAELIEKTNGKAYGLIKRAAKLNIVVLCEYIEVKLASRTYLVDPLRIVGN